jgi:hypothetical protein
MRPDFRATWEQNWPYMLIAFALSLALWLSVSAEGATQQEIPVKLIVQNLDPRYVMTSRPPDRVTVSFRGSGRDLLQLAVLSVAHHDPRGRKRRALDRHVVDGSRAVRGVAGDDRP